jgi:hypothetical protein
MFRRFHLFIDANLARAAGLPVWIRKEWKCPLRLKPSPLERSLFPFPLQVLSSHLTTLRQRKTVLL